ncbi:multiple C2 and transmembrane domain-containing protein 1 isoform X2 [Hydra vulgaris]|uniref:Multiple C2 and transmembrane domain-containing protein 1 isoform X2 n=1 Tax=Hydra vulgaris TaxID=6087 RepID=A0ABM4DE76_HYDVU
MNFHKCIDDKDECRSVITYSNQLTRIFQRKSRPTKSIDTPSICVNEPFSTPSVNEDRNDSLNKISNDFSNGCTGFYLQKSASDYEVAEALKIYSEQNTRKLNKNLFDDNKHLSEDFRQTSHNNISVSQQLLTSDDDQSVIFNAENSKQITKSLSDQDISLNQKFSSLLKKVKTKTNKRISYESIKSLVTENIRNVSYNEQLPLTRGAKTNSKCNISDSVLSVTLREGKNLKPVTHAGYCDVFVRFKLGVDKYKSRVSKHTNNPVWNEQFDMKLMMSGAFSCLEASVWDKESGKEVFIGRGKIDISTLTAEKTHDIELNLEDQPGVLYLYLCITGLNVPGCISDLTTREEDQSLIAKQESNFSLWKTVENFKQIGWMQIKVHRANGLAVADLGGASDPFAIIELANQRLVTPTIYKTLNPQWEKVYELIIYDIHDALEITIFDEDKRGPPEFLGRVKIPLLSIKSGEKCVYQLRDKRLQTFSKGNLIMTATIFYNSIRASLRTFTPKEIKVTGEAPKFRRQLLQENVNRVTNLIQSIIATSEFIQSLFTWKYKLRSGFAFLIYILFVWNFDWFMLPLILFLALLKNYVILILSPTNQNYDEYKGDNDDDDDDDEENEDKSKKGKSKTFREKWEAINHICTLVQNHLNNIASFGERIKNTFAWTVPFLSFLLMVILLLATIVLYIVPLRYLLLLWGINKFTKKIRKPHAIANNEFLDFLSRVPSDPEVKQFHQHLGAPLS